MIASHLPPLYSRWIAEFLSAPIPEEPMATCADCAMVTSHDSTPSSKSHSFNPLTKCCTYVPELPNFLVGRTLNETISATVPSREALRSQLDSFHCTPRKLAIPADHKLLMGHARGAWGQSERLRCPYFRSDSTASCGIWRHRNAICSTWFCKHSRGVVGHRFWLALRELLFSVERALSLWCLVESDLEQSQLALCLEPGIESSGPVQLGVSELDGIVDEATRVRQWGKWLGREAELFRRCGELVSNLSWSEIRSICGPELKVRQGQVEAASEELSSAALPERAVLGTFELDSLDDENVRVVTYSPHDPLELPRPLLEVLPLFNGRPLAEAVLKADSELGIQIDHDLLQLLFDFEILYCSGQRPSFSSKRPRTP